ncbi:hypothetical protein BDW59DRAFT_155814 [Aspergillus cavernicola]|uniref:Uncharacterized protein n=1 Tax=Aspergillus cavernicola TaxID=176166 RepID=A0ABR4J7G4_9EURO
MSSPTAGLLPPPETVNDTHKVHSVAITCIPLGIVSGGCVIVQLVHRLQVRAFGPLFYIGWTAMAGYINLHAGVGKPLWEITVGEFSGQTPSSILFKFKPNLTSTQGHHQLSLAIPRNEHVYPNVHIAAIPSHVRVDSAPAAPRPLAPASPAARLPGRLLTLAYLHFAAHFTWRGILSNARWTEYQMSQIVPPQFDEYGTTFWIPSQVEPLVAMIGTSLPAIRKLVLSMRRGDEASTARSYELRRLHSSKVALRRNDTGNKYVTRLSSMCNIPVYKRRTSTCLLHTNSHAPTTAKSNPPQPKLFFSVFNNAITTHLLPSPPRHLPNATYSLKLKPHLRPKGNIHPLPMAVSLPTEYIHVLETLLCVELEEGKTHILGAYPSQTQIQIRNSIEIPPWATHRLYRRANSRGSSASSSYSVAGNEEAFTRGGGAPVHIV